MKRSALPLLLSVVLTVGCGKGELDPGTLTSNPFDPDYEGPSVFELDSTYMEINNSGPVPLVSQIIAFQVKDELLPEGAAYAVRVIDAGIGLTTVIDPNPPNSDHFTYSRPGASVGIPVCLELSLFNNLSAARAETICATL